VNVKIISYTRDPITQMYLAAKRCYTSGDVTSHAEDSMETKLKVVEHCIRSGHLTVAEFVDFTFSIEGVTRDCTHQLVRHRHCSFCEQSGRRVRVGTFEEAQDAMDLFRSGEFEECYKILQKYFRCKPNSHIDSIALDFYNYNLMIHEGKIVEVVRDVLPGCTLTNILLHCNLRALIEMSKLRLCSKAQSEIMSVFRQIKNNVKSIAEDGGFFMAEYLNPKCFWLGRCNESKGCGFIEFKNETEN